MLFERSSDTQKARQPTTWVLMTWIVPCTPVFGRAEESVDEAPTHQTEPEPKAANGWAGCVVARRVGVVSQTYKPPVTSKRVKAKNVALIGVFASSASYTPRGA